MPTQRSPFSPTIIGIAIALAFLLIITVVPTNPELEVTLRISHSPSYSVAIEASNYTKIPYVSVIGNSVGQISLSSPSSVSGSYTLNVTITYSNQTVSSNTFTPIGDGSYLIRAILSPRSENVAIPYVVTLTLFFANQQVATTIVSLYPK